MQPSGEGKLEDVGVMADRIIRTKGIDGITVSGGEPMMQAEALTNLLAEVSLKRPELTVIIFTGFQIEDLQSEHHRALLRYVDVLIDGEYKDSLNDNLGLRGSSNQRVHFLSSRLLNDRKQLETGKRIREMHVLNQQELLTIGIADRVEERKQQY